MNATGSPAHAGIDPTITRHGVERRRFPRTRGDRAHAGQYRKSGEQVPPHTRG